MISKRMQTERMWECEIALKAKTEKYKIYIYLKEKLKNGRKKENWRKKKGKSQISIVVKLASQQTVSVYQLLVMMIV